MPIKAICAGTLSDIASSSATVKDQVRGSFSSSASTVHTSRLLSLPVDLIQCYYNEKK